MDFLTFKSFISIDVLILFYYLGALILPIAIWILRTRLIQKYKLFNTEYVSGTKILWKMLYKKQQTMFIALLITFFLCMELFWRIFFEFLIAYMQMRDALLQIQI